MVECVSRCFEASICSNSLPQQPSATNVRTDALRTTISGGTGISRAEVALSKCHSFQNSRLAQSLPDSSPKYDAKCAVSIQESVSNCLVPPTQSGKSPSLRRSSDETDAKLKRMSGNPELTVRKPARNRSIATPATVCKSKGQRMSMVNSNARNPALSFPSIQRDSMKLSRKRKRIEEPEPKSSRKMPRNSLSDSSGREKLSTSCENSAHTDDVAVQGASMSTAQTRNATKTRSAVEPLHSERPQFLANATAFRESSEVTLPRPRMLTPSNDNPHRIDELLSLPSSPDVPAVSNVVISQVFRKQPSAVLSESERVLTEPVVSAVAITLTSQQAPSPSCEPKRGLVDDLSSLPSSPLVSSLSSVADSDACVAHSVSAKQAQQVFNIGANGHRTVAIPAAKKAADDFTSLSSGPSVPLRRGLSHSHNSSHVLSKQIEASAPSCKIKPRSLSRSLGTTACVETHVSSSRTLVGSATGATLSHLSKPDSVQCCESLMNRITKAHESPLSSQSSSELTTLALVDNFPSPKSDATEVLSSPPPTHLPNKNSNPISLYRKKNYNAQFLSPLSSLQRSGNRLKSISSPRFSSLAAIENCVSENINVAQDIKSHKSRTVFDISQSPTSRNRRQRTVTAKVASKHSPVIILSPPKTVNAATDNRCSDFQSDQIEVSRRSPIDLASLPSSPLLASMAKKESVQIESRDRSQVTPKVVAHLESSGASPASSSAVTNEAHRVPKSQINDFGTPDDSICSQSSGMSPEEALRSSASRHQESACDKSSPKPDDGVLSDRERTPRMKPLNATASKDVHQEHDLLEIDCDSPTDSNATKKGLTCTCGAGSHSKTPWSMRCADRNCTAPRARGEILCSKSSDLSPEVSSDELKQDPQARHRRDIPENLESCSIKTHGVKLPRVPHLIVLDDACDAIDDKTVSTHSSSSAQTPVTLESLPRGTVNRRKSSTAHTRSTSSKPCATQPIEVLDSNETGRDRTMSSRRSLRAQARVMPTPLRTLKVRSKPKNFDALGCSPHSVTGSGHFGSFRDDDVVDTG